MKKIYYFLFAITGIPGLIYLLWLDWRMALAVSLIITGNNFLQESKL